MRLNSSLLAAFLLIFMLLLVGTLAYRSIEGWSWLDSFYFTSMTLTTIGHGELYPSHDMSKLFTIFFAFSGIATFFYALNSIVGQTVHSKSVKLIERVRKDLENNHRRKR